MATNEHDIRVPTSLKAKAVAAKWEMKMSVSALLRSLFEEYAAGKTQPRQREEPAIIRFSIDDAVWTGVVMRAADEGVSVSEVARGLLEAKLSGTAGQGGADGGRVVLPTGKTPRGGTAQPR